MKIGVNTEGVFPTVGEAKKEPGTALATLPTKSLLDMMEQQDQFGRFIYDKEMLQQELYGRLYKGFEGYDALGPKLLELLKQVGEPVWSSQDKRAIPISKMENQHLINAINKIVRKGNWRKDWLPVLHKELERRTKEQIGGEEGNTMVLTLVQDPVRLQEMINWGLEEKNVLIPDDEEFEQ